MPFFLDTQEAAQRFGTQVAEFGALLEVHGIRHGSPSDLFEFARMLEHSEQLRTDLSTLVRSVVRRAHEEILLTDMMGILAAAVGGPLFDETRVDMTRPTNVLMEFLLGTGCWRSFGAPAPRSVAPQIRPPMREEGLSEARVAPAAAARPAARAEMDGVEDRASLLNISNELRQTLSQLESSATEVKRQLDSIDRRIARAEQQPQVQPRWEAPPAPPEPVRQLRPAPEPVRSPFIERAVPPRVEQRRAAEPEPELPMRGRPIFSQFLAEEPQVEEENFSSPTFAYASEGGRNMIPVGVFLALLVVLIAGFFFAYSRYGQGLLKSGVAHFRGGTSAPAAPLPGPAEAIMPASAAAAAAEGSTASSAAGSAPSGTAPVGADAGRAASGYGASGGSRYVPANVMEGRLLAAPRPEYPANARLNRIEGQVAMQATISRSGSVMGLHVVKGPPALRRAALDAVRQWRYRPYTVDGRPVDVSTMVYVDFALRASPTIVR